MAAVFEGYMEAAPDCKFVVGNYHGKSNTLAASHSRTHLLRHAAPPMHRMQTTHALIGSAAASSLPSIVGLIISMNTSHKSFFQNW